MSNTVGTINNRKIRIGILGFGQIARKHIKAITSFPNELELVAICEAYPNILEQAMQEFKVDGYTSLTQMLKQSNLDVLAICTPSGLHARQTIETAQAGKHIITEKPMATRWQDGIAMVQACDAADVKLFVVKQNRTSPVMQLLKQAITEQRFGKLYHVNCNVYWTRPQDYYDKGNWRGTWEMDGGALMNQACHYVDLLHWLFGPIESVQAMTATLARKIEAEDSAVMNLRWRNGMLGSMSVSMLTYPENYEASFIILGEKGTVRVGGVAANKIEHWKFSDQQTNSQEIQQANELTTSHLSTNHIDYYKNVIAVLQGKTNTYTDGREGLKTLELLVAAYQSARDTKTINLPLEL